MVHLGRKCSFGRHQQPHSDYLLLAEDNQICGFIGYSKVIDEVEITNIAVAVSEQGKGHARHLLQLLITEQIKDSLHVFRSTSI